MARLTERLAGALGMDVTVVRMATVVVIVVLVGVAIFAFCMFCCYCDQKSDFYYCKGNIPEAERYLSELQFKVAKLERELNFCETVVEKKVLAAAKELNLALVDEEVKELIGICKKVDSKKIRHKLEKRRRQMQECEEWLKEAREKYATLSEKFGVM